MNFNLQLTENTVCYYFKVHSANTVYCTVLDKHYKEHIYTLCRKMQVFEVLGLVVRIRTICC